MALASIWILVVLGYLASRAAEWRIHRRNYQILREAGAEEAQATLMRLYYLLHAVLIPAAVCEQLSLAPEVPRSMLVGGLTAVLVGQMLRFWSIQSLGSLWTMRCLALAGLHHRRQGPYRFIENPEYLSRLIDGVGLCLVFGAKATACVYLILALALGRRIVQAERLQAAEHDCERRSRKMAAARAS